MEYLTGKDYPYLCEACRAVIDTATLTIREAPDTYASDPEGPCNWVYDHRQFCGGRECVNRPGEDVNEE